MTSGFTMLQWPAIASHFRLQFQHQFPLYLSNTLSIVAVAMPLAFDSLCSQLSGRQLIFRPSVSVTLFVYVIDLNSLYTEAQLFV